MNGIQIQELINFYTNKTQIFGVDYRLIDHSDGNGIQIEDWNIKDKSQPTIDELFALNLEFKKQKSNDNIKSQITEIESKQSRALREMIVSPNNGAKQRLLDTDKQIQDLRLQIQN